MRLPSQHTCPICASQFPGEMWEVAKEGFRCPHCNSEMPSLKAEYQQFLFEIGLTLFLEDLLRTNHVMLTRDDFHAIISRTSLSADELTKILLKNPGKKRNEDIPVFPNSLERIIHKKFVEDFGSDVIDITRYNYEQHFALITERENFQQQLQQRDHKRGEDFFPSQTFMLHTYPYYSSKTRRPGFHFFYFPQNGSKPNEIYYSAEEAYQGYLCYQERHIQGYITIFSEAYCMPISERFLEKLQHAGYSLQAFQTIEHQEIDKLIALCTANNIAVYINESDCIDCRFDKYFRFQSAPWKRLN